MKLGGIFVFVKKILHSRATLLVFSSLLDPGSQRRNAATRRVKHVARQTAQWWQCARGELVGEVRSHQKQSEATPAPGTGQMGPPDQIAALSG